MFMKRFFSVLLISVMMLSVFPVMAENDILGSTSDQIDLYRKRLEGLGVIPIGMSLDGHLTRGEMANIINKIFIDDEQLYNYPQKRYSDVSDEDAYFASIHFVSDMGIMNGYGDGTFRPENSVTYVEISKILISIIGYHYLADMKGGYPAGYISIAAQNNILPKKGINSYDDSVKKSDAIYMVYQTLNTAVMERELGNDANYAMNNSRTLMKDIMQRKNLYYSRGIVTSDGVININKPIEKKEDYVIIDNLLLDNEAIDLYNYLGKQVEFWYVDEKSSSRPMLTYIYEYGDINKVVTYDSDMIQSGSFYEYIVLGEDNETEKIELSNPRVVYNGQGLSDITADKLVPENGTVTLIDNDDDGKYDVVFVWDKRVYIVSDVRSKGYNLIFKDTNETLFVDPDDEAYTYIVRNSNGEQINPIEIAADDVVSIAKSSNGKYITVFVSKNKVGGAIDEYNKEDGIITINGIQYHIVKMDGIYKDLGIDLNSSGTFYLDENNKVVFFEEGSGKNIYAMFVTHNAKSGLGKNVEVKVVTAGKLGSLSSRRYWWQQDKLVQGKAVEVFELADRVKIDGMTYRAYETSQVLDQFKYEVVQIELNNDRQIKTMTKLVPEFIIDSETEAEERVETEKKEVKFNPATESIRDGVNIISLSGSIDTLAVPKEKNQNYDEDALLSKYRIVPDEPTYLMVYDIPDNSFTPKLLVKRVDLKREGDVAGPDDNVHIVNKISKFYDELIGECYRLSYYDKNGYYTSNIVRYDVEVEGVKTDIKEISVADIIFIHFDYKGYICKIEVRETPVVKDRDYGKIGNTNGIVYGKIKSIKTNTLWEKENEVFYNIFEVDFGNGAPTERIASDVSNVIFKYSKSKNEVTTISVEDIVTGKVGLDYGDELFTKIHNKTDNKSLCTIIITK